MVFFGTMSLFMTLWILDSSTPNAAFGSREVRGLMTSVFAFLTLVFWYTSYEIYASARHAEDDDDDPEERFISKKFRERR